MYIFKLAIYLTKLLLHCNSYLFTSAKILKSYSYNFTDMHNFFLFRVMDQHKLTKEQWEERIMNWWAEHKGMPR